MPRVRSQLALQLPPDLIARVKAEADRRGQTLTVMVRGWLEAALEAPSRPAAGAAAPMELEARLSAVEARLLALEQGTAPRLRPPASLPVALASDAVALPSGAITTAELAERTGMKRGSLNERVRRAGGAHVGLVLTLSDVPWRCVGQEPARSGGPPRWLWVPD